MSDLFPNHYVILRDAAGVALKRINGFTQLTARITVNGIDTLKFTLPSNSAAIPLLVDNAQMEYWRIDPRHNIGNYRHFSGLYQAIHQVRPQEPTTDLTALGDRWLLSWRIVAWAANTADRSYFSAKAAETIMKQMVKYNETSSATTGAGRKVDGTPFPAANISVAADAAGGNVLDWYANGDNLLTSLQNLALVAGGDFDLVKSDLNVAALGWAFNFYPGQRGTDRSATLTFSVGNGSMLNPVYDLDRTNEATIALVGGQGIDAARQYTSRTGVNYASANHREMFVPATDVTFGNTAGLQAAGDKKLAGRQARAKFAFGIRTTDSIVFQRDFFLGDLASAVNPDTGDVSIVKVNAVTVELAPDGSQTITGECATL